MPSGLTPCPVCKTAEFISVFAVDDDIPRMRYDVECNNCGTRVYYAGGSEEEAIAKWNRSMERANRRMTNEPSLLPWHIEGKCIYTAHGDFIGEMEHTDDARLVVDAVNERDKLKAECDRLRTAYADLWRAIKRIEADSRLSRGKGLEVASLALNCVHTYASSAIRAAEKKGFAP